MVTMNRLSMLVPLLILCACDRRDPDNSAGAATADTASRPAAAAVPAPAPLPTADSSAAAPRDSAVYVGGDSTLRRTLSVVWTTPQEIRFHYLVTEAASGREARLSGTATLPPAGDSEEDADEDGNAYTVDEYGYHAGDCDAHVRIDSENPGAPLARVTASQECESPLQLETSTPLRRTTPR
jgi:hypothetical protein